MPESHLDEIAFRSQDNKNLTTIIKGVRIDLIGRIVNTGLRYIYVLLLARLLGANLMGIFFLGVIIIDFFSVISRLGLDNGVLKYVAVYNSKKDKARVKGIIYQSTFLSLAISIIIGLILLGGANFIAQTIFHKPELRAVLRVLAISLPFSTIMLIYLFSTQAFHTLKYRVYVENFVNPILNIMLVLAFFLLGWNLKGVTTAYVLSFVGCAILSFYYSKKLFPEILISDIKPIYESKQLLKFSTPLLLVGFLNVIMMWTDILMLGYFKTGVEVGIYNTVVKTAFFINFIIISFTSIFAPRISELYSKRNIRELEALFKIITKWIFALSLPIFVIIVLFSKNILFLFGAQFVVGYISLTILAVAHLINASVGSVKYILMMSEKEKVVLYDTIGICLLNILLNLILIPKYSINGAAMATACSIVTVNLIILIQVYKYLGIHPYNFKYLKPLFSGLIVTAIGLIVQDQLRIENSFLALFLGAVFFPLTYFSIVKIFRLDEQDLLFLQMIKIKVGKAQI